MAIKKKPSRAAAVPTKYRARIRMYRQGLGDCFLLTFPKQDGTHFHVMIDCGVVLGTPQPKTKILPVAKSLRDETGGKIDVLVITHEHWDHLSGFTSGQAQEIFDEIKFGQLWLAWTEDPKDWLANSLRRERNKKRKAVLAGKAKLKKTAANKNRLGVINSLLGFEGLGATSATAGGSEGTPEALKYLKRKIKKQRTFKPGGKLIRLPGVEGVRVFVLGPPKDRALLKRRDPKKGEGYGLSGDALSLADAFSAALTTNAVESETAQPFPKQLRITGKKGESLSTFEDYDRRGGAWRKIDDDWLSVTERLALQLDSDTNNTSLVLAFEFKETEEVLLFVGDAQAGNWRSWEPLKWRVKDADDQMTTVTAAHLLERTIFYKCGHHGSHNATLRDKGLERMSSPKLVTMIPVNEEMAKKKGWGHMPLPALCDRLEDKCAAVVRLDKDRILGRGRAPAGVKIDIQKLYVDYYLKE